MRIRILRPFYYQNRDRRYVPGEVVDLPEEEIGAWLKQGMAMQDKSLDGASEIKAIIKPMVEPEAEIKSKRKRKSRR